MYVPPKFAVADPAWIARFIAEHPFATVVTTDADGTPFASHLPLLFDAGVGDNGTLHGHMAKANPQWHHMAAGSPVLAVFAGPHRYVSPSWYAAGPAVPTWNYAAVHVYGRAALVPDSAQARQTLEALVERFEAGFDAPWCMDLPADFERAMLKGIMAFDIAVSRIEAKAKLSQNRPEEDQRRVAAEHAGDGSDDGRALAALMAASSG